MALYGHETLCEESLTKEENREMKVLRDSWDSWDKASGMKIGKPINISEDDIKHTFLFFRGVKQAEKRMIELVSGNIKESEFTNFDKLLLQDHKLEMEEELQEGFIDDYYED